MLLDNIPNLLCLYCRQDLGKSAKKGGGKKPEGKSSSGRDVISCNLSILLLMLSCAVEVSKGDQIYALLPLDLLSRLYTMGEGRRFLRARLSRRRHSLPTWMGVQHLLRQVRLRQMLLPWEQHQLPFVPNMQQKKWYSTLDTHCASSFNIYITEKSLYLVYIMHVLYI